MKPQNFVDTVSYDSVRPNADQFTPDEEEGFKSTRDYRIFKEKAGQDEKYSQFNSSFQTIHNINDIKIKVEEGEMKDASERFNLGSMKIKIVARSQNSMTVIVIGVVGLLFILTFVDQIFMSADENIMKSKVVAQSELSKEMQIENEETKKRVQVEKEKKLKHEELMKIIQQKDEKKEQKSGAKKLAQNQRMAWSKLVDEQKEEFMVSSEKVI